MAHGRAHLSGRHHLALRLADALERAFPGVRFFAVAAAQVSCLVEMAADDAATRRPRLALTAALLAVAASGFPPGRLVRAAAPRLIAIQRLIDPPVRGGMARRAVTAAALAAVSALALAAVAVTVVAMVHCPAALNSW